jgi:hypothetical protein
MNGHEQPTHCVAHLGGDERQDELSSLGGRKTPVGAQRPGVGADAMGSMVVLRRCASRYRV